MSKISTYTNAQSPLSGSDKLIGTETGGIVDNATKNFTVQELADFVGEGVKPYKLYTALLTQTGTDAPVAIVLENTLGGVVVWSYENVGLYKGTLNDAFPEDKTAMFITSTRFNGDAFMCISLYGGDIPNAIAVETLELPTYISQNDLLYYTTIEIRVYN
jgi:hypothetical protein